MSIYMSIYNSYAQKLNAGFLKARELYVDAYTKLKEAQARLEGAKGQVDDLEESMLVCDLRRAEAIFRKTDENVWLAFNDLTDELTKELQEVVATDGMAVPEGIDRDALALLESGILNAREFESLRCRFADANNSTMLRIMSPHVEKAIEAEQDPETRRQLVMTKQLIDDGLDGVLRRWADLLQAARVCSGQSRDRKEDPGFITKISQKWEELTAASIENF